MTPFGVDSSPIAPDAAIVNHCSPFGANLLSINTQKLNPRANPRPKMKKNRES